MGHRVQHNYKSELNASWGRDHVDFVFKRTRERSEILLACQMSCKDKDMDPSAGERCQKSMAESDGDQKKDIDIEGKFIEGTECVYTRVVLCFRDGSRKILHSRMGGRDAFAELMAHDRPGTRSLAMVFENGRIRTFNKYGADLFVNATCKDFEGLVKEVYETAGVITSY